MCIAAGLIGAAVVGGVGSAVAANQSSKAIEGSTNAAINQQNKTLSQQQTLQGPYQSLATGGGNNIGAIQQYENLLGLNPSVNPQQALAQTPGYQFTQQQGTQNTVNQASAMGLGLSGNTLEGLSRFNAGLADSTYQQAVTNASNAVQIGQASAANQAANLGSAGANISNALIGQGQEQAGIQANEIAGITKAVSGGINNYEFLNTLQGLNSPGGGTPITGGSDPSTLGYGNGYIVNTPGYP